MSSSVLSKPFDFSEVRSLWKFYAVAEVSNPEGTGAGHYMTDAEFHNLCSAVHTQDGAAEPSREYTSWLFKSIFHESGNKISFQVFDC